MNRYQTATPRTPMMIAAVAISALTLGLSVLPAILGSAEPEARLGVAGGAKATAAAAAGVAGTPMTITVFGVREPKTAFDPVGRNLPARKEAS